MRLIDADALIKSIESDRNCSDMPSQWIDGVNYAIDLIELYEPIIDDTDFCSWGERKDEPKICDFCRYYNNSIPCGSTPSACKEADKFAEEFVDGLKKLKPKDEPQTDSFPCNNCKNHDECCTKEFECKYEPQTDCGWK